MFSVETCCYQLFALFFFAVQCLSLPILHLLCLLLCFQGYIRSEAFNPKTWIVPGVGYDICGTSLRKLKSKRIADSVEALIGAYLSAAGEQAAYIFLKSLGMDIEFHKMPVERIITIKPEEFINVKSLELLLDYSFNDPSLLMEALTHGSYQIAGTTACYQVGLEAAKHFSPSASLISIYFPKVPCLLQCRGINLVL
jgi:endoribonuclease Dicer